MRIYYDTEFVEDGRTIDLVSIGIIADNGDEYYAVSNGFNIAAFARNPWLVEHVWPSLPQRSDEERERVLRDIDRAVMLGDLVVTSPAHKRLLAAFDRTAPEVRSRPQIRADVADFILSYPDPELWAWYGAYDHVALAQLFGGMIELPDGVPMWTNDLKQECQRLGNPTVPEQANGEHNALADARHNRTIAHFLDQLAA
jgi:hypothetical protein